MVRDKVKRLRVKSSTNMGAAILLVLVLVVMISLLSERHYLRWDVTLAGEHTLSEKTLQVLKTVNEPVEIKAFVREGYPDSEEAERLLSAYHYRAPNITFTLIDPERNPAVARRYHVRSVNTFVMEGYERAQTVKIADEESITNGLLRLSQGESHEVYWVTGHGEREFTGPAQESLSIIQENLSKENYRFEKLNLLQEDIPRDASLLIVAAPLKPFFPEEVESIKRYLREGGSVLIFLEPFNDAGLEEFLKTHGILIAPDMIVDKLSRVMGGDYLLPMVANYGFHEITKDFRLTSFFHMARSVREAQEDPEGITLMSLASTSASSWAETDRKGLDQGRVAFDGDDRQGPLSLAVIAELELPAREEMNENGNGPEESSQIRGKGKLVVYGDVDFASNRFFNFSGNGDLITNTINYLVGRGNLITIQKKHRPVEALMLNRGQGQALFWIPVVLIPLLVLAVGMTVWHGRRSR